jgi:hypothetical protein
LDGFSGSGFDFRELGKILLGRFVDGSIYERFLGISDFRIYPGSGCGEGDRVALEGY